MAAFGRWLRFPLLLAITLAGAAATAAAGTPVALLQEHLLCDLQQPEVARVRATYQLQNRGGESLDVTVGFPMRSRGTPNPNGVWLDGQPLPTLAAEQPIADAEADTQVMREWLDPFSGGAYRPPESAGLPDTTQWALFHVPFRAAFGTLDIEALTPPGRSLRANLALARDGAGRYAAHFDRLPPDNLSLFLAPGFGSGPLASWWWRRPGRAWPC